MDIGPNLYFFAMHNFPSFEDAVAYLTSTGVKPTPADNSEIVFEHIFFAYTEPEDFRIYFPEHSENKIVAIKVEPKLLQEFGKGKIERYGLNGSTRVYIRFLEEDDIFPVDECEFSEV